MASSVNAAAEPLRSRDSSSAGISGNVTNKGTSGGVTLGNTNGETNAINANNGVSVTMGSYKVEYMVKITIEYDRDSYLALIGSELFDESTTIEYLAGGNGILYSPSTLTPIK